MCKIVICPVLAIVFLVAITGESLRAQISVAVTGDYSETIDAIDLQSGAGSDLIDSYESSTTAVSSDISGTAGVGDNWRVDIKKSDTTWDSNLYLDVKRTTDGTGSGSISGGIAYQEITDIDLEFFGGDADRADVKIQLRLRGVSVQILPDTYSTTVYYTVVDTS